MKSTKEYELIAALDDLTISEFLKLYNDSVGNKDKVYKLNNDNILRFCDEFFDGSVEEFINNIGTDFDSNDDLYFQYQTNSGWAENQFITIGDLNYFNNLSDYKVCKHIINDIDYVDTLTEDCYQKIRNWRDEYVKA